MSTKVTINDEGFFFDVPFDITQDMEAFKKDLRKYLNANRDKVFVCSTPMGESPTARQLMSTEFHELSDFMKEPIEETEETIYIEV